MSAARERELAYIAKLEEHQDGRRDAIKVIEDVIVRKQIEIENRKARLETLDDEPARNLTALQ